MTTLDRAGRVAAGVAVAAFAGVALVALVVGTPTAGTIVGTGMMGGMRAFPVVFFPFMFLTLAALLALGYVGIRALADADEGEPTDERVDSGEALDPVTRLQRRYTKGELSEEEFERALERELADGAVEGDGEPNEAGAEYPDSARERQFDRSE